MEEQIKEILDTFKTDTEDLWEQFMEGVDPDPQKYDDFLDHAYKASTQQLLLLVNEIRDGQGDTPLQTPRAKNIKVNDDGTISPIDPSKPSSFSSDFSERGVIRAILLNMEWCHTVKTDSLEKTVQAVERLVNEARIDEATKACYEWEKSPNLPATYLIDRIAELRLLSEEK